MSRSDKASSSGLAVYQTRPPGWLPEIHRSGDLGYYGFHPPRPGQEEDVLNASTIQQGYAAKSAVNVETASAHALVNESRGTSMESLARLEELMNDVFARRAERVPNVPPSTFRLPTRVTLNDAKRQAWFKDLADPTVPLHKLGKSVPHGAKGHDLLDLLYKSNVPIDRAVWFLRVFGSNETAALRNKPSYNPNHYSVEWANVVTSYMKKQLADIALPSAPRPGLNIKQSFKGVLTESDARERWISRFSYCLQLLRKFYAEGLVDKRVFLTWLVHQLGTCNLAQAAFVFKMSDEYLEGVMSYQALLRPFLDACLAKYSEIRLTGAQEHLVDTANLIKNILQRICLVAPNGFVSPRMWTEHSSLLLDVFSEDISHYGVGGDAHELQDTLITNVSSIKTRNEAMLFCNLQPLGLQKLGSAVADIKMLNSISAETDLDSITFFSSPSTDVEAFATKLNMLLTWSTSPLQYGDHRPFVAVALLKRWRLKTGDRATRRDITPPDEFIQDQLFQWLDTSEIASNSDNLRAVAMLYGELVEIELFSYAGYIQRLIARSEEGLSFSKPEAGSRHRCFLRWIPLHQSTPALISQRRLTLHGARVRETPEVICERELRKELRSVLPDLFPGSDSAGLLDSIADIKTHCSSVLSAPRYEQVKTFRDWLVPIIKKKLSDLSTKSFYVCTEIMSSASCFASLQNITLAALAHIGSMHLLDACIEILLRYRTIWTCMDIMGTVTQALFDAHNNWKKTGVTNRFLVISLFEMDAGRYLDGTARQILATDIAAYASALQPQSEPSGTMPAVLPEILLLANGDNPEGPSMLAGQLWYRFRFTHHWAMTVWDNTVASIRQIPDMNPDVAVRRARALRYGIFLTHVDQHLPTGLDDQVLQWFLGPGQTEISTLSEEGFEWLCLVLVYLVIQGSLKTITLLRGFIYPAWQLGSHATIDASNVAIQVHAANTLFSDLMLRMDGTSTETPPRDFSDIQHVLARRDGVYHEPHCTLLVSQIPILARLEGNWHLPDLVREEVKGLRESICTDPQFRGACHRNLDTMRLAYEQELRSDGITDSMEEAVLASLELALSPEHSTQATIQWKDISTLLSPWQLAATALKLQFSLRKMVKGLSQESSRQAAAASIDEAAHMIFHHKLSPEESFFVAEIVRGADGPVAIRFINNGLRRVATTLTTSGEEDYVQSAGNLLRVIAYVAEPLRTEGGKENATSPFVLDPDVQSKLLPALGLKIRAVYKRLSSASADNLRLAQETAQSEVIFLARLLHFDLGFEGIWPPEARNVSKWMCETFFRLALLYAADSNYHFNLVTFPLLLDTLLYLLDEMPPETRSTASFDPFRNYPTIPPSEIPISIPENYRQQLLSLLANPIPSAATADLATAHRTEGNLVPDASVVNHPWEWAEYLGEPAIPDDKVEEEKKALHSRYLIRNSGSIPLNLFGAEATGDGVPLYDGDKRLEGQLQTFEDGLTSETMYQRDYRQMRVEVDMSSQPVPHVGTFHSRNAVDSDNESVQSAYGSSHGTGPDKRSTPRGSPSSVVSRSSAHQYHTKGGSRRTSPSVGTLPSRMSVDRESVASTSAAHSRGIPTTAVKRKVAAPESDDEIEIIEGPSQITKKTKTKAPAKARTKRK